MVPELPYAIEIRDLSFWYDGPVLALNGVSLAVEPGELLAITGQNGSGKTTLAKHLNGLLRPGKGRVRVLGLDTRQHSVGEMAHHVGYVFQNPHHQIFSATVWDELAFGPRNLGLAEGEVCARVAEWLEAFGLDDYAAAPPALLSFGLKRKVTLAAVCSMRPQVLVLDEPTVGLDRGEAGDLMARVDGLHRAGRTVVLITHDMRLVAEHATRVAVLHQGRLLAFGPTRQVFRQGDLLARTFLARPQIAELSVDLMPWGTSGEALSVEDLHCELEAVLADPEEGVR